jgi:hypothetical protein
VLGEKVTQGRDQVVILPMSFIEHLLIAYDGSDIVVVTGYKMINKRDKSLIFVGFIS